MSAKNLKLATQITSVKATESQQDRKAVSRAYHAPELHTIGKAVELVQGGGGGNYLDANRTRYY